MHLQVSSDTSSTIHKRSTPKIAATIIVAFLGIAGLVAATVYFTDGGGKLMSLMTSSSTDEPSKIVSDVKTDFINIDLGGEEGGDISHVEFESDAPGRGHLGADVFHGAFFNPHHHNSDLNDYQNHPLMTTEEGTQQ